MKKIYISLSFFFFFWINTKSQDIRIYHGIGINGSVIFLSNESESSKWPDSTVIIKEKGVSTEITVLNANPLLYSYEFKMEDFEIKGDFPDITSLLEVINAIPEISSSAPQNQKQFLPATPNINGSPFEVYLSKLEDLKSDLLNAKKFITDSDIPEGIYDALNYNATGGYRLAAKNINGLPGELEGEKGRFNSPSLEKDLTDFLNASKTDLVNFLKDPNGNAPSDASQKLIIDAFTLLNKQLIESVNLIKKAIKEDPVVRVVIPNTGKNVKVRLIIKKKSGFTKQERTADIDKLVCVVISEYSRPSIELVPVGNLTFAGDIPAYAIENGIITQKRDDGFKFRVGAMIISNLPSFGKYKEQAVGIGLGYNIPKKGVLDGFFLGSLYSYKSKFRVGLGIGFSSYAFGLKNNASVGNALPSEVKNLDDILDYKRKLSGFLSFSVSGITLKN